MQKVQENITAHLSDEAYELAFNLIVKAYGERMYWHIRRLVTAHEDANDVLQNTYIKIWKGLANFKQQSAVYTWVYRIATNEALSFIRSQKNTSTHDADEHSIFTNLQADVYFDGDQIQAKFHAAIATLPPKQRAVFTTRYFEELTYEQMSEIFQTSVGALKASYHHAVKKIELSLKAD
jgi:RNA polymerase sigma-70 factor (ECF subfamily)